MGTCQFSTCLDVKDVEHEKINIVHGKMECTDIHGIKYNLLLTRNTDKKEKKSKSPIKTPERGRSPEKKRRSSKPRQRASSKNSDEYELEDV